MREYDIALKTVLQHSAETAVRELTGVTVARWLNVELPEVRDTRVDLLGERAAGKLVHIELQSTNDPKMALRMAEYYLRIYRLFGKFPRQVLVYVGEDPLRMSETMETPAMAFRYRAVDIRELDGDRLLDSRGLGDNVIAVLARLRDAREAVRRLVGKIAALPAEGRGETLNQLTILVGLRHLGDALAREVENMPILNDILDHDFLGPKLRKSREQGRAEGKTEGELTILRGQIEARFGSIPDWLEARLLSSSTAELQALSLRLLRAGSIEELLGPQ